MPSRTVGKGHTVSIGINLPFERNMHIKIISIGCEVGSEYIDQGRGICSCGGDASIYIEHNSVRS